MYRRGKKLPHATAPSAAEIFVNDDQPLARQAFIAVAWMLGATSLFLGAICLALILVARPAAAGSQSTDDTNAAVDTSRTPREPAQKSEKDSPQARPLRYEPKPKQTSRVAI